MYGFVALLLLMFAIVAFFMSSRAGEPERWRLLCWGLASAALAFLIMIGPTVYEHWLGKG
jgi:hypothetical protein